MQIDFSEYVDEKPELAGLAVILFAMGAAAFGVDLTWQHVGLVAFGCLTLVGARYYRGVTLGSFSVSEQAGKGGGEQ